VKKGHTCVHQIHIHRLTSRAGERWGGERAGERWGGERWGGERAGERWGGERAGERWGGERAGGFGVGRTGVCGPARGYTARAERPATPGPTHNTHPTPVRRCDNPLSPRAQRSGIFSCYRLLSRTSREFRIASPIRLKATTVITMHSPAG
jgi:hypothetical protein